MNHANKAYFKPFKGRDGQFYFSLKAPNNKIILKSEGYTSAAARDNGIQSVKTHAPSDSNYKRLESRNNEHYFNLLASNYKTIGTSETYNSRYSRDQGIEDVKRYAPRAVVKESALA